MAKVDDGPLEKLTGVPTAVFDQLVKGVVAADDELELKSCYLPHKQQVQSVKLK